MLDPRGAIIEIEAGKLGDSREKEIYRNLQVLYGTQTGEQALDRDFGIDMNIMDYPQESAMALLAAEYVRKTERYEPRAQVKRVKWTQAKERDGIMIPKVVVSFV
ncbi:MAG: GPW/gp25 family protein [Muribaculaceae bacterium]|nr:GPW/gp25 family protein [Muribaculaceae bacterium]MCM1439328.1 GPW/gp25 family protein [Roseburia sp.]